MLKVVKRIVLGFVVALQLSAVTPVSAAEPVPVPTEPSLPASPLMITAYQASADGLDLVQIYNNSDELVSLDGMQLRYSQKTNPAIVASIPLNGLIIPKSHILVAAEDVLVGSDRVMFRFAPSGWVPKAVWIESPTFAQVTLPSDVNTNSSIFKRGRTTTGYSTAASAFSALTGDLKIEADMLYEIPPVPALEFVEVLARSRTCSPFDIDITCNDYIKLRMLPGFNLLSMSDYRVKTGSGESVTNTFSLENASVQGNYLLLRQRNDGEVISLTNSGGYLWLEDTYGLQQYESTLVEYASASSEAYINQSWALNDQTTAWQWGIPSPLGANTFAPAVLAVTTSTLGACPVGKYRNPETNRCRTIEEAVNELAACEEGKERNPTTNRCRSIITTATASLTPCDLGEERNPLTNRCRKIITASQTLVPCAEGQERNPDTNRCRKATTASASSLAKVADVKSPTAASGSKVWLLAGAAVLVLGYAVYEWRQDIAQWASGLLSKIRR